MNIPAIVSDLVTGILFVAASLHIAVTQQIQADLTAFIGALVGVGMTGWSLWSHYQQTRTPAVITPISPAKANLNLLLLAIGLGAMGLGLWGCAAAPAPSYLSADQSTYNAIAPEFENYVNNDPALSPEEKQRRIDTVNTWQLRINHAASSSAQAAAATQPSTVQPAAVQPSAAQAAH